MIQVLVVAAVRFYREGLADVLRRVPGVAVCGTACSQAEAWTRLQAMPPDVMLLDAAVAGAAELARGAGHPAGTRVVVMAVGDSGDDLVAWAEVGVDGYVGRDGSVEELVDTVRAAARGELRCSAHLTTGLLRQLSTLARAVRGGRPPAANGETRLTTREREIVELIAGGLSNKAIARRLGIGPATAKNHVHNILRKLQVQDRADAVAWARLHPGPVVAAVPLAGAGAWTGPPAP